MQNQLQKAIELAQKTGDKIIVFDSIKSDSAYAVMSLKDYEDLLLGKSEVRGLTEDELIDKINRDVAVWKSEQEFNREYEQNEPIGRRNEIIKKSGGINSVIDKNKLANLWSIPKDIKEAAEEVIEEDRQYLEDIIF